MDYPTFKKMAGELTGLELNNYKSQQMDRRINSLKNLWNIETYEEFFELLRSNPQKYRDFINRLTINVSEFFRNPERYHDLWKRVLPDLLSRNGEVKIWSAGCSNGAEPFSVAIIARELNAADRIRILGTDVDREILHKAQNDPRFTANDVKCVPVNLREKYFEIQGDYFRLKDSIHRMVTFRYHNLHENHFDSGWDMIICRNVVIYFTNEAKNILYKKFYDALKPGGYLWVGGTEPLLNYKAWGYENPVPLFYQKPENIVA